MENYKQKYKEAFENLKRIKTANKDNKELVDFIEYKYPELKESKDEKVRNFISNDLSQDIIPDDEDIQWLKSLKERIKGE